MHYVCCKLLDSMNFIELRSVLSTERARIRWLTTAINLTRVGDAEHQIFGYVSSYFLTFQLKMNGIEIST